MMDEGNSGIAVRKWRKYINHESENEKKSMGRRMSTWE
jgi:hypothetical protein